MARFETWFCNDLTNMVRVEKLPGTLFSADNGGNLIGVEILDHGEPANISGGVVGYAIRSDGRTVIINGTLSANKASITLPASAYISVGPISIVIKVGTTTVCACTGNMYRSSTDEIIDPGHFVPSLEELLAHIQDAIQAAENANNAATNANTKANAANTAAGSANSAATTANTAATNANNKAIIANTAADNANGAATKINDMSVSIASGDPTQPPTATLTLVNGHYNLAFNNMKGLRGETGEPFHIKKTYASVAAMNADYSGTDTQVGDYVMVVSNVQDPDNAKVYIKGSSAWQFVVDMSGSAGIKGDTGNGISNALLNSDYTLTLTFTDGTSYTTPVIRGKGIKNTVLNGDYTLTITFDDDTTYTTASIRGDTGATGPAGRGIQSTVLNSNYTLTITFTDGTTYTTESIRGATGQTGETGATPNITMGTVTTLNAGSSATASMTGTPENPVLNLGIPRGYDATILSQTNFYQASTSGTTIPTGQWETTIPTVPQGSYLWIKHQIIWNDNTQSDVYSVSRQGVDGSGSVVSLLLGNSSLLPDASGVVTLPLDNAPTANSGNLLTSGTIQTQIAGLSARIDALDPEQRSAIFTDVAFTIATSDWTLSNGLYTYTYSNVLITASSGIEVFYDASLRTAIAGDIYVTKNTGNAAFVTTKAPIGTLTGTMRVIESVVGTLPVTKGGTGATDAAGARENLDVSIRPIPVSFSAVSSLPQTFSDSDITSDMVPISWVFSNPAAVPQGIKCTTANGAVTISLPSGGSISGETNVAFSLVNPR